MGIIDGKYHNMEIYSTKPNNKKFGREFERIN
jgi:hypothetical protein